jgi:hypothetical protein
MPNPLKKLATFVRSVVDFLFGYDFFISYAHKDGMDYPQRLANRLIDLNNFRVFLDTKEYVAGTDLQSATKRRIRMSKKLLVIVRPEAMRSDWVAKEVDARLALNRVPIAIVVNQTLDAADADAPRKRKLQDIIYIHELIDGIDAAPSDNVVQEVARSFRATRQETLRMRVLSMATVFFLMVAIVAAWQGWVAEQRRQQAASRLLASQSQDLIDGNLDLALLLAASGQATADTFDTRDVLLRALQKAPRLRWYLHSDHGQWQAVAL